MQINLTLQNSIEADNIPSAEKMQQWIKTTLEGAEYSKDSAELTIRIVSAEESQQLNSQYRGKHSSTNVLSFPFEPPAMIPASEFEGLLGDLAICCELVISEAIQQDKKLEDHWAHLIVHGVLHLLGFDHMNDADAQRMEQLERAILKLHKIQDPYL